MSHVCVTQGPRPSQHRHIVVPQAVSCILSFKRYLTLVFGNFQESLSFQADIVRPLAIRTPRNCPHSTLRCNMRPMSCDSCLKPIPTSQGLTNHLRRCQKSKDIAISLMQERQRCRVPLTRQRQHGEKEVKITFDLGQRKRLRIENAGGGSHTGQRVSLIGIVHEDL